MSVSNNEENLRKWRLILGDKSDPGNFQPLPVELRQMDATLNALYDSDRKGGLGSSSPNINRWLGDIRKYFPAPVVQLMQKDALEQLGLKQMLLEPELLETVEADVHLAATLLTLNKVIPARTKETARVVVKKVVESLEKKLLHSTLQSLNGALNQSIKTRRPKPAEIDWHRTIRANLRHYQPALNTIIPVTLRGFGKRRKSLKRLILLIDQSGSMAESLVYSAVFGAILASLRTIQTQLIVFDTSVADLTEYLDDPVELLFGAQLGGGTDINLALAYAEKIIQSPSDTILVLISDLYEGGNRQELLRRASRIKATGVQFITLLALSNEGAPAFDRQIASQFANLDIPAFGCTPDQFPEIIAAAIKKESLSKFIQTGRL